MCVYVCVCVCMCVCGGGGGGGGEGGVQRNDWMFPMQFYKRIFNFSYENLY